MICRKNMQEVCEIFKAFLTISTSALFLSETWYSFRFILQVSLDPSFHQLILLLAKRIPMMSNSFFRAFPFAWKFFIDFEIFARGITEPYLSFLRDIKIIEWFRFDVKKFTVLLILLIIDLLLFAQYLQINFSRQLYILTPEAEANALGLLCNHYMLKIKINFNCINRKHKTDSF